jgi:hypothetical protein
VQKARQSVRKLQTIYLVIVSSALAAACAGLPDRPAVDLCTIDLPRAQLICSPTGDVKSVDDATYSKIVRMVENHPQRKRIPLERSDRYICFAPDDWQKVSVYMKSLRDYAQQAKACQ